MDRELNQPIVTNEENKLRPTIIDDYIGQGKVKERVLMYCEAALIQNRVIDHILLTGAPGLGKTTLAHIIANKMGTQAHVVTATTLKKNSDVFDQVSGLKRGDVLFIDEIHRLTERAAVNIYMAMEDFKSDFVISRKSYDSVKKFNDNVVFTKVDGQSALGYVKLNRFTLIGATTRQGTLPKPLLDRFGIKETLQFYSSLELAMIVSRSASKLNFEITNEAAIEIGKRGRGTPRIANKLLERCIDYSVIHGNKILTGKVAKQAFDLIEIDSKGLNNNDIKLLKILSETFKGKAVGLGTLCGAMNEEIETVEDLIEPYLIQTGLIAKTSRGRIITEKGITHLSIIH